MPNRRAVVAWNLYLDFIAGRSPHFRQLLRLKLYCGPLNYRDRCYLASYCFLNGFPPNVLCDAMEINERHNTVQKQDKVLQLYNYWSVEGPVGVERRGRYFAFNTDIGRITDLNGIPPGREERDRIEGGGGDGDREVELLDQICGDL